MGRNFNGDSSAIFKPPMLMILCSDHTKIATEKLHIKYPYEFNQWLNGGWPGNFPFNGLSFNFITAQDGDVCCECLKEGIKNIVVDGHWTATINECGL